MFIVLTWPNNELPAPANDLLYLTVAEAITAARFILNNPANDRYTEFPRLTVHPVGGLGGNGVGPLWDSEMVGTGIAAERSR